MKNKKIQKKIKRKIRYDRILVFLLILCFIIGVFIFLFSIKITNIYILNNSFLKDQYIIEKAMLSSYPSTLDNPSFKIEKKLEEDVYVKSAKVYKKGFTKVYIEIIENKPLFYYDYNAKTILEDGQEVDTKYSVPTVVNYITDEYYDEFINKMSALDKNVLNMISEIKFSPNEVDDNRFLLFMSDGNFVYINIDTFEKLNIYLSIKEGLPNKAGILYLDYGNNFEILK